ncbi:MAG: hypothetical protein R3F31_17080 [Verrucomicrobiales bacterium]
MKKGSPVDDGRMVVTWTTQGLVVFWGALGGAGWALFRGDGMLLALSSFLICLVGFARWANARNGAGLGVKRHLPGRVTAGLDFEVGLSISSSAGRRRALKLRDAIAGAQADCLWIDTIPGGGLAAGRVVGRRWRRGRATAPDCGVSSRYPLGFFEMRAVVPVVGDLSFLVLPRPAVPPALREVLELARWEENADLPDRFPGPMNSGEFATTDPAMPSVPFTGRPQPGWRGSWSKNGILQLPVRGVSGFFCTHGAGGKRGGDASGELGKSH